MTLAKNNPQLLKDTAIRAIEWFKGRTWENAAEILSEVI
jgi:hypothetical protein